ncbi:MAG TPA: sugar phosphate isomerase/epimerase [Solirubrobacter sp.]|nr:sugar phosphate isomerase/epimerase [Solirubrobacter sp.]
MRRGCVRARSCVAIAVTGIAVLAAAGPAQAQRPASVGDGVPTGQGSVQLFNYGNYLSRGANEGDNPPPEVTGVSEACRTSQSSECRRERLEALFAFLARKGVTSVELFGHAGFPASDDIPALQEYRALLDKYGLHAGGWHGSMNESEWDTRVNAARILGADYIGSGGVGSPGIGSYDNTLRTAETLNRLGKRAVEGGVGPVYIHNHTGEFDAQYVHNGVLMTAFDILMQETDPRYVAAELDVFWSSDAFNDVTGEASASLINKWPTRIKMLHMKDGINVVGGEPGNSRSGNPEPFGTGEVDFRPILAAARGKVQYYHQEEDGGTMTGADISLSNLKGVGSSVVGTVQSNPVTFPTVAAGTPAADNVVAVKLTNVGDAPLSISDIALATSNNPNSVNARREGESPGDFSIISDTCEGATLPGAQPPTAGAPGGTRASCVVHVGFKPTTTNFTSLTRLIVQSNADDATEQVLLVGRSTGEAMSTVGGDVASTLSLSIGGAASFGTFVPATARTYDTAVAAQVVSTAGNASLSVVDPSATAPGHLVNGAFSLSQPLQVRALNAANPDASFAPLPEANTPLTLLTYTGPTAGADPVTVGLRQAIGATEVLRSGSYSKTLTFTLSTTNP